MTLEQLRVFVAVAERQHVTRAAEALNLAQSAASAAIAALEARHGAKLFNRVGRGIALTEAGTLFLAEARAILARVEAAELVLSDLGGLLRGTLAIQASHHHRQLLAATSSGRVPACPSCHRNPSDHRQHRAGGRCHP